MQIQNDLLTPNDIYVPQIVLQTVISNGRLLSRATITLMPARRDGDVWQETGGIPKVIIIDDVENLDEDLAGLQDLANQIMGGFIGIIAQINAIRKVL